MKKKGISPIIATAILVALVVSLAVIVWLFLSGFVSEIVVKQGKPAATICVDNVKISAAISGGQLTILNEGQVPLAGFIVKSGGSGKYYPLPLNVGESGTVSINCVGKAQVIPEILGRGKKTNKKKLFACKVASVEVFC